MRVERREKQPSDYAPIGVQCGSRNTHTSAHKHIHFKHNLQREAGKGVGWGVRVVNAYQWVESLCVECEPPSGPLLVSRTGAVGWTVWGIGDHRLGSTDWGPPIGRSALSQQQQQQPYVYVLVAECLLPKLHTDVEHQSVHSSSDFSINGEQKQYQTFKSWVIIMRVTRPMGVSADVIKNQRFCSGFITIQGSRQCWNYSLIIILWK